MAKLLSLLVLLHSLLLTLAGPKLGASLSLVPTVSVNTSTVYFGVVSAGTPIATATLAVNGYLKNLEIHNTSLFLAATLVSFYDANLLSGQTYPYSFDIVGGGSEQVINGNVTLP